MSKFAPMKGKISEFEVMAPVGSRESLAAAIQAGADSVYFGIGKLNMRSHSANHFNIDDLRESPALDITHHLAKLYPGQVVAVEPNIEAARSCAVWPDATLEQLQDEKLLMQRLPALMQEFKKDIEALGFIF